MNKRIPILAGSPRKEGNSDLFCAEFEPGAKNTGRCVKKDDMRDMLSKMIAADAIVLATPVCFYAMNGQMKTLIARTVEEFRGFMDCLSGAGEKAIIRGTGAWAKGEIRTKQEMKVAYAVGKNV